VVRLVLPLFVVFALLVAGCGGSTVYTEAKTKACLQARGATIAAPNASDIVASTALGGAFSASLGDNSVKLVFGQNDSQATNLVLAYERFAFPNVKSGLPDVLRSYNNVVTLWHEHPQDGDLSLVIGCLR
jgi:hypothetical protein